MADDATEPDGLLPPTYERQEQVASFGESSLLLGTGQDVCFISRDKYTIAVFDGNGPEGNRVASLYKTAVQGKIKYTSIQTYGEFEEAIQQAHKTALDQYIGDINGDTTATIAKIAQTDDSEKRVFLAHSGDSRAYGVRRDGKIIQLTTDDNPVSSRFSSFEANDKRKKITQAINDALSTATSEEDFNDKMKAIRKFAAGKYGKALNYDFWKNRHRIKSIREKTAGGENALTISQHLLTSPDPGSEIVFILLTTDGVHDVLTIEEIEECVQETFADPGDNPAQTFADKVTQKAQERQEDANNFRRKNYSDDITAVVLQVNELPSPTPPSANGNRQ